MKIERCQIEALFFRCGYLPDECLCSRRGGEEDYKRRERVHENLAKGLAEMGVDLRDVYRGKGRYLKDAARHFKNQDCCIPVNEVIDAIVEYMRETLLLI